MRKLLDSCRRRRKLAVTALDVAVEIRRRVVTASAGNWVHGPEGFALSMVYVEENGQHSRMLAADKLVSDFAALYDNLGVAKVSVDFRGPAFPLCLCSWC